MATCPLCGWNQAEAHHGVTVQSEWWKCLWCGEFKLWGRFQDVGSLRPRERWALRGLAVERKLHGGGRLEVNSSNFEMLMAQAPRDPTEQADRFLLNLKAKSSEPAIMTAMTSRYEAGLAFADAHDAIINWLNFLKDDGLIEYVGGRSDDLNNIGFRLTLDGWRRVRELESKGPIAGAGFVAMPFAPEFDSLWEQGIQAGLASAGWDAIRADKKEHSEKIDDWILNQIRATRFLVAETTGNNAGVSFEAGYALAVPRPVIWLVSDDSLEKAHFDFRQYNHMKWKPGEEAALVPKLAERIIGVVGRGPKAPTAA